MPEQHILDLIKPLFPENAEFRPTMELNNLVVGIDWKLNSDIERPNKRSKTIILNLGRDFLDDHRDGNQGVRSSMDAELLAYLNKKMTNFESDHDTPYDVPNPKMIWMYPR